MAIPEQKRKRWDCPKCGKGYAIQWHAKPPAVCPACAKDATVGEPEDDADDVAAVINAMRGVPQFEPPPALLPAPEPEIFFPPIATSSVSAELAAQSRHSRAAGSRMAWIVTGGMVAASLLIFVGGWAYNRGRETAAAASVSEEPAAPTPEKSAEPPPASGASKPDAPPKIAKGLGVRREPVEDFYADFLETPFEELELPKGREKVTKVRPSPKQILVYLSGPDENITELELTFPWYLNPRTAEPIQAKNISQALALTYAFALVKIETRTFAELFQESTRLSHLGADSTSISRTIYGRRVTVDAFLPTREGFMTRVAITAAE